MVSHRGHEFPKIFGTRRHAYGAWLGGLVFGASDVKNQGKTKAGLVFGPSLLALKSRLESGGLVRMRQATMVVSKGPQDHPRRSRKTTWPQQTLRTPGKGSCSVPARSRWCELGRCWRSYFDLLQQPANIMCRRPQQACTQAPTATANTPAIMATISTEQTNVGRRACARPHQRRCCSQALYTAGELQTMTIYQRPHNPVRTALPYSPLRHVGP